MNTFIRITSAALLGATTTVQAMTWAQLAQQQRPPEPVIQTRSAPVARFWSAPKALRPQGLAPLQVQPPAPLLYWSWYQAGSYDNPWTLVYRDGWWSPPVRWGTPMSHWTQYQLYQWWGTQARSNLSDQPSQP